MRHKPLETLQSEYFMLNHERACHYLAVSSHSLGCAHYTNPCLILCPTTEMSWGNKDVKEKCCVPLQIRYISANIVYTLFMCSSVWGNGGLNIVGVI